MTVPGIPVHMADQAQFPVTQFTGLGFHYLTALLGRGKNNLRPAPLDSSSSYQMTEAFASCDMAPGTSPRFYSWIRGHNIAMLMSEALSS